MHVCFLCSLKNMTGSGYYHLLYKIAISDDNSTQDPDNYRKTKLTVNKLKDCFDDEKINNPPDYATARYQLHKLSRSV